MRQRRSTIRSLHDSMKPVPQHRSARSRESANAVVSAERAVAWSVTLSSKGVSACTDERLALALQDDEIEAVKTAFDF